MELSQNQRWHEGRDSYRPAGEVIETSQYDVVELPDDTTPKEFVRRHHYTGEYPAARFRFGLYRSGVLSGVAVMSHPVNDRTLTNVFGGRATDSVELGRLVLLDQVPGNGESWFVARVFDRLRKEGLRGVVSFSDPTERSDSEGKVVKPGHLGTVYQALSARYLGTADSRTLRLLPDGQILNHRAEQKIKKFEKGWRAAAAQLVRHGAVPLSEYEDPEAWLSLWLPRVTRPIKHPGNFKYAWGFDRFTRKAMPPGRPYPKVLVA